MRSRPDPSSLRRVNLPLSPENAGASRRKPTPARPCTVARVVMNRTERSDQAIALWRCAARMRRIDGLGITAEVLENPFNDCWRLDAGDDTQVPAALPADLDVNGEHPLETLQPLDGKRWCRGAKRRARAASSLVRAVGRHQCAWNAAARYACDA